MEAIDPRQDALEPLRQQSTDILYVQKSYTGMILQVSVEIRHAMNAQTRVGTGVP